MSDQVRPRNFTMNTNLHRSFVREVARLRKAVRRVDLTDERARAGLVRRFEFFSGTLHHHHEGEDQYLFGKVRVRATPEEVVVLDAMEAEHEALNAALTALDEDFHTLGPDSDGDQIAADFDELEVVLNNHCAHEERHGVKIIERYITDDDLKQFMKFTRARKDSMMVLAWVCDGATPAQVSSTWSMMPSFVRVFVKPISTRKYRAFTAECGV